MEKQKLPILYYKKKWYSVKNAIVAKKSTYRANKNIFVLHK